MDKMLQFFEYSHLPPHLQEVSAEFNKLATYIVGNLPSNAERTTALRKLVEAKDCAVRARLYNPDFLSDKTETDTGKKPNTVTYEKVSDERPNTEKQTYTFKE